MSDITIVTVAILSIVSLITSIQLIRLEKRIHQLELDRLSERQREMHAP